MPGRGGWRQGAGRKAAWELGETQTIRVPVALKDTILDIGRELDQGQEVYHGKTCVELQKLVDKWEAKCQEQSSSEWESTRELLAELKSILANRQSRHRHRRRCHQRHNSLESI